jgi:hypothetical protein
LHAAKAEQSLAIAQLTLFGNRFAQVARHGVCAIVGRWQPDLIVRDFGVCASLAGFHASFEEAMGRALHALRQDLGLPPDSGWVGRSVPVFCRCPLSTAPDAGDAPLSEPSACAAEGASVATREQQTVSRRPGRRSKLAAKMRQVASPAPEI